MQIKASVNLWEESFGKPFLGNQEIQQEKTASIEELVFQPVELKLSPIEAPDFIFIDGVMRKDVSLHFEAGTETVSASLFTIGAGAVSVKNAKINLLPESLLEHQVRRFLLIDKPDLLPQILLFWKEKMPCLPVEIVPVQPGVEFNESINLMRQMEGEIVHSIQPKLSEKTIVITDGNLHYPTYPYPVVGYVKSISKPYPDEENFKKNRGLMSRKKRSSIFEIRGNNIRLSWYISLSDNQYVSWLNNLARLEVYQNIGLEKASEVADLTAAFLPDFILHHVNRYPQNLAPIQALEKELGSYMGNKAMIKNLLLEGIL